MVGTLCLPFAGKNYKFYYKKNDKSAMHQCKCM